MKTPFLEKINNTPLIFDGATGTVIYEKGVFLIYDDLSILPKWIDHLDWMDKYLEVRTIKKHDFGEWLIKN